MRSNKPIQLTQSTIMHQGKTVKNIKRQRNKQGRRFLWARRIIAPPQALGSREALGYNNFYG